jgi:group I intron endonuclease
MLLLGIITLVMTIPLASLYLSTISSGSAFLIILYSSLLSYNTLYVIPLSSGIGILGGLFQISIISQSLEIFILIIGSAVLLLVPEGKEISTKLLSLEKDSKLLRSLAYIILILTIFIIIINFTNFQSSPFNSDVLLSLSIPAVTYNNAEGEKNTVLTENKGKAGIYQWTYKELGKIYVGSAFDLYKRFLLYYSKGYLEKNKSYINNALLLHGYSKFSLSILEYIDVTHLSKEEARKLILEREQFYIDELPRRPLGQRGAAQLKPEYNINPIAGSRLGSSHSEDSKAKISEAKSGENNPMYGRIHTETTKDLMSELKAGENNPMFGKCHSAESLEKISAKLGTAIFVYDSQGILTYTFNSGRKAGKFFSCDNKTIMRYVRNNELFLDE